MSSALTQGIRITVRSAFRPERSSPVLGRFLFSYDVEIANEGKQAATLRSRHWIITDAGGVTEEVVGDGVVGHQPHLGPGERFEYSSFCVLRTPHGTMRGSYRMVRDDGAPFDAEIAPFTLVVPGTLN